jgi:hypothetical protein
MAFMSHCAVVSDVRQLSHALNTLSQITTVKIKINLLVFVSDGTLTHFPSSLKIHAPAIVTDRAVFRDQEHKNIQRA